MRLILQQIALIHQADSVKGFIIIRHAQKEGTSGVEQPFVGLIKGLSASTHVSLDLIVDLISQLLLNLMYFLTLKRLDTAHW